MWDAATPDKMAFSIKAFPVEARKLAVACAARAGLTMAEWMDRAVHSQARLEAGENLLPPDPGFAAERLPPRAPAPDFTMFLTLMQAAQVAAQASGVPMSKRAASSFYALIYEQVRLHRSLPSLQTLNAPPVLNAPPALEVIERIAAE